MQCDLISELHYQSEDLQGDGNYKGRMNLSGLRAGDQNCDLDMIFGGDLHMPSESCASRVRQAEPCRY